MLKREAEKALSLLPISVGNTPLVKLDRIAPGVFGKCENLNPTGSVKDRAAAGMLQAAIKEGRIKQGVEILDSSSGNTGISLAAFGASLGLKVTIVLPKNASIERQRLLRLYGANVVYSDPLDGSDGAIILAREMFAKDEERYLYLDQYSNDANWKAHYYGTGLEIWEQTRGKITHFVSGVGTGGTVMGTGRRLKEMNHEVKIVAVEPDSPFHGIEGLKHIESAIRPKIFDENFPDETIYLQTEVAQRMVLKLASEQGIFVGTSSGATVAVASQIASRDKDAVVVAILADQGSRYLSEKYLDPKQ